VDKEETSRVEHRIFSKRMTDMAPKRGKKAVRNGGTEVVQGRAALKL